MMESITISVSCYHGECFYNDMRNISSECLVVDMATLATAL